MAITCPLSDAAVGLDYPDAVWRLMRVECDFSCSRVQLTYWAWKDAEQANRVREPGEAAGTVGARTVTVPIAALGETGDSIIAALDAVAVASGLFPSEFSKP
jgi:hypothetical protein